MKKTTLLLVMLLSAVVSMGQAAKKSVFLYAGQSNADGREYVQNLPDYMMVGTSPYSPYTHLKWASICGNPSKTDFGTRTMATGERYAFCDVTNYWIDQAVSEDFYAIKCAYGGTAIAPGVTVAKLPIWYADATWMQTHNAYKGDDITQEAYANNNSLTKNLTEGLASLIDGTLAAIDGGYDVKAIMWHQGESDRNASGDYYTNFKTMIAYMRQAIYAKTGDEADLQLPFIFGTVCRRSSQYSAGVESAQRQVAEEDANVYLIDMQNATLLSDNLHFDRQATEYLGKKMYNQLVTLGLVTGDAVEVEEFPVKESVMDAVTVPSPDNRSWDFSAISQETLDALAADVALESGALWNYNSGWGYRRGNSIEEEQLHTAADYVIPETQGLYFTSSIYNRVSITSNSVGFVTSDAHLLIPKMVAGQTVTFTVRANKETINVSPDLDTQSLVELVSETKTVGTTYTNVTYRVRYNVTQPTHMGFTMGGAFLQKVQIKTPNTVNILIGADQKETFACDQPLDFSPFTDLFKAYVVTGYDEATGKIDCEQVLQVPANTGVLLIGEESTVNAPIIDGDAPVLASANLLTAVVGSGLAPAGSFVLTTSGGVTQFTKTSNAVSLNNQAYLALLGTLDAYDFNLMATKTEHVYDMPTVLNGVSALTFTDAIHHSATDGSKTVDLYAPANVVAMDGRFAFTNSGWGISNNRIGANKGNTLYGSVVTLENGDRVKLEWGANDASAVHVYDLAGILRGVSAGGEITNGETYVVEAGAGETVNLDLKMYCGSNRAGFSKMTVWTATETTPIYQVATPTAAVELQSVGGDIYKAVATLSCATDGITYYYKGGDVADWTSLGGSTFEAAKKAEYQLKATADGFADSEVLTLSLGYLYKMTKTVVDLTDEAVFTAATKDENGFDWTTANYVKMTGMPEGTVYGHISGATAITGITLFNNNTDARYSFAKGYGLACNYGYWMKTTTATAYDFAEYEVYDINTAEIQTTKVLVYNPNNTEYVFRPLKAVRLYEPVEYSSEVTTIGWATLSLPYTAVVPEGTSAYYVSNYTDGTPMGTLTLKKVKAGSVSPANEGFLLNAAEGTYQLKAGATTDTWTDNLLVGTADAALTGYDSASATDPIYVLAKIDDETVGFKKFSGTAIDQYKAYLQLGVTVNASAFRFAIDGETTGINASLMDSEERIVNSDAWYTIDGRMLNGQPTTKGVYIHNGRIMVIK